MNAKCLTFIIEINADVVQLLAFVHQITDIHSRTTVKFTSLLVNSNISLREVETKQLHMEQKLCLVSTT